MSLMSPARVGHGVAHSASGAARAAAMGGIIVGGAIVAYAGPEIAAAGGIMQGAAVATAAAGTAGYVGIAAVFAGKAIDKLLAPSIKGHLVSGFPTVHLGSGKKDAARAAEDTKADCDGEAEGFEGSSTVFLGGKPMSRVGDRLKCAGKIAEGEKSIGVGGAPSQEGKEIEEPPDPFVHYSMLGFDAASVAGARGGVAIGRNLLGLGADAVEHPTADAIGLGNLGVDAPENLGKFTSFLRKP